jgi:hypothetical protein
MKLAPFAAAAAALAAATLGTGCFWVNEHSDSMYGFEGRTVLASDGHVEGGQAHAELGMAGLYIDAEANRRDVMRDDRPDLYHGYGLALSVRGSLFGILGTTHELERYLDLGAEAGGGPVVMSGIPGSTLTATGGGFYGAWIEIGTVSIGDRGYLALTGGVRRESFGAPFTDQTQLAVGLAWRHREPANFSFAGVHD